MTISAILMWIAFVSFLLEAGCVKIPRVNLLGLGLALWMLAMMLAGGGK